MGQDFTETYCFNKSFSEVKYENVRIKRRRRKHIAGFIERYCSHGKAVLGGELHDLSARHVAGFCAFDLFRLICTGVGFIIRVRIRARVRVRVRGRVRISIKSTVE